MFSSLSILLSSMRNCIFLISKSKSRFSLRRYSTENNTNNASKSFQGIIRSDLGLAARGSKKVYWLLLFPIALSYAGYDLYTRGQIYGQQIEKRRSNMKLPPTPLPSVMTPELYDELDHRLVYVSGELLHERELRVLPKSYENQIGLYVFTPLRRTDGSIVIINRGWVPAQLREPESRIEAQVSGPVTILGHLIGSDDPFPFKFFSERPVFTVLNVPEHNQWYRVRLDEMAEWVNSQPVLISALENPPNPGGYPIGGQTDFKLDNWMLREAYKAFGTSALMVAVIFGGKYWHRLGKRFPWQKGPPKSTPFTIQ